MSEYKENPGENKPETATCPCLVCTMDEEETTIVFHVVRVVRGLMFCYKMFKGLTVLAATIAGSYTAISGAIKLIQG